MNKRSGRRGAGIIGVRDRARQKNFRNASSTHSLFARRHPSRKCRRDRHPRERARLFTILSSLINGSGRCTA